MAHYDTIGIGYARRRRADARIAGVIERALGDVESVVNVGAGVGSYEPASKRVIAVEPSAVMIQQRAAWAAPCLLGSAEALPMEDKSVDGAMAVLTVHHWADLERGLAEMGRVARRRVVIVTWVPEAPGASAFWLTRDYFPEILAHDRTIFPSMERMMRKLESVIGPTRSEVLMVPHDCQDGFLCAYWRRPGAYVEASVRAGMSSFSRFDASAGVAKLGADLASGAWGERNGELMKLGEIDVGYRVFVCEVGGAG